MNRSTARLLLISSVALAAPIGATGCTANIPQESSLIEAPLTEAVPTVDVTCDGAARIPLAAGKDLFRSVNFNVIGVPAIGTAGSVQVLVYVFHAGVFDTTRTEIVNGMPRNPILKASKLARQRVTGAVAADGTITFALEGMRIAVSDGQIVALGTTEIAEVFGSTPHAARCLPAQDASTQGLVATATQIPFDSVELSAELRTYSGGRRLRKTSSFQSDGEEVQASCSKELSPRPDAGVCRFIVPSKFIVSHSETALSHGLTLRGAEAARFIQAFGSSVSSLDVPGGTVRCSGTGTSATCAFATKETYQF